MDPSRCGRALLGVVPNSMRESEGSLVDHVTVAVPSGAPTAITFEMTGPVVSSG